MFLHNALMDAKSSLYYKLVPQIAGIRKCVLCDYNTFAVTMIKAGFQIQIWFFLLNLFLIFPFLCKQTRCVKHNFECKAQKRGE